MALKGFDSLKGLKARVTHTAKEQEKERAQQVQAQLKAEEDHHEFEAEMRRMGVKVEKKKENAADLFAKEMARLGVVKMGESAPRPTRRRTEPIPRQKLLDEKRVLTESLSDEFDCGTYLDHDEDLFLCVRASVKTSSKNCVAASGRSKRTSIFTVCAPMMRVTPLPPSSIKR